MDNMQLWLSSSTDSINLNDSAEGFYLNPDLEGLTGLPEIRSVNGNNAGYDGGWTATQLWAARLITIRGVIAINDKAAVETKRKALAKILSQGKNENLELKFVSEAGNTYTTTVRTSYCTMALQRVFWRQEYQIQLRANDPLIYDDGGSELVAILRVMAGEGGFEIPFDIPFTIGGSIEPTSVDVGDEATYPLIRLKGDLHNPTIINMTTNQRMQVLADIITTIEWRDYTTTYTTDGFAQIGDGLAGAPLSLTQLTGNATQETLSGKNKMPMASADMTDSGARQNNFSMSLPAGTYTISFNIDSFTLGTTPSFSLAMSIFGAEQVQLIDVQMVTISSSTSLGRYNKTFTISADGTTDRTDNIRIGATAWSNGARAKISNIQIETGSTATDYQEYCGGVPMPNPSFPSPIETVTGAQTVKITGKNLLDTSNPGNQTNIGGMTSTWNNGAVDVKGTNTATSFPLSNVIMFPFVLKAGTTITVSTKEASSTGNTVFRCLGTDGVYHESAFFASGTRSGTLTLSYDIKGVQLYKGSVPTNVYREFSISEWQIEIGSSASDFEPYQGQSQEINLGKNLLDINSLATTGITVSNGVATGTARAFNTAFGSGIPLKVPALVSISLKAYTDAETTGTNSGLKIRATYTNGTGADTIVFYNNDTTATYKSATTSNNKELEKIAITFGNLPDNTWHISEFQIEASPLPTTFAPYKTPLELAKIGNYQDYIYNDNGTWKIHKETAKIIYDGSEGWSLAGTGTNHFFFFAQTKLSNFGVSNAEKCNIATLAQIHSASSMDGFQVLSDGQVRIRYAPEQTVADWKTFLGSTNMVLYYALATPTDTEITDSELIEQLNHIYSLYQGTNNLWLIPSAGAQGEMGVSYATTEDIDYHEVVIDCQARTVTQDGHNLYPALAEGSEFIRLLPGENKLYLTSEVESDNGTAEVKFKKGNISI